jgi:hypothetical protein
VRKRDIEQLARNHETQSRSLSTSLTVSYLIAALAAVAAALVRYEFNPLWGSNLPFITFYPAVALAA